MSGGGHVRWRPEGNNCPHEGAATALGPGHGVCVFSGVANHSPLPSHCRPASSWSRVQTSVILNLC